MDSQNIEFYCSPGTKSSGFTPLMHAVMSAGISSLSYNENALSLITKILKEDPLPINTKNTKGWTALMLASGNSNKDSSIETVKLLIDSGADVNAKDKYGWTALMLASWMLSTNSLGSGSERAT